MNYSEIGFKSGLEIHQQLDTEKKLFCNCKSRLTNQKAVAKIMRKQRPVAGELGEVDAAAAHELLKNKTFEYDFYPQESCLVEADEEPPHPINPEALKIGLQIALLLNCEIPDEIHVMRKTVIDGSNTSGFQRTSIIGLSGWIETSKGKVGITSLSLEEDSAQILDKKENKVVYGLDRLGIPLLEIGTAADVKDPEHAKELAEKLGLLLKSVKVKKGLGTIRQDVNVSIKGGARVEIKGFQELSSIPVVIENEIKRQQNLIKSGKQLEREVRKVEPDCSTSFLRPLPGAARLYPETDIPPIPITKELVNELKRALPERWEDKLERFIKKYKLEKALAENLLKSGKGGLFEEIANLGFDKNLVLRAFSDAKNLGVKDDLLLEIFKKADKTISKEALQKALEAAKTGRIEVGRSLPDADLRKIIKHVIEKNKDALQKNNPLGILMGEVMKEVEGRADGKKIAEILSEEIK